MGTMVRNMTAEQVLDKINGMLNVVSEYHGNLRLCGFDGPVRFHIEVNTKTKRDSAQLGKLSGVLTEIQRMIVRREHYEFDDKEAASLNS